MNGPNSMYKLKPIVKVAEEIDLPKCMYRMKTIQNSYCNARTENMPKNSQTTNVSEQVKKFLKLPLPEVAALESRQEAILEQLAQLKKQMSALRAELKVEAPHSKTVHVSTTPISMTSADVQVQVPIDIVINAHPQWPPFSLLALKKLSCLSLNTHIHSTVNDLPQPAEVFTQSSGGEKSSRLPISVRLIWKNVPDAELIVGPSRNIVRGEVNILRYLSRLGPPQYNYELSSPALATGMDCILDLCYSLVKDKTVKDRQADVRILNSHLKKTQFLMGNEGVTLPDIAAWSALKQIGYTTSKELTVNLTKWFQRCTETFALVS